MIKKLWQHKVPQPPEACDADPIVPSWDSERGTLPSHYVCADCGRPIKQVDSNEGPEALKSLFRF
jgi:hypothetical protein